MSTRERTLSEFLQHSGRILPELAAGQVLLRRRDGEDLVVMTRGQYEAVATVLRTLAGAVNGSPDAAEGVLPWLAFLSAADREACLRELGQVAAAALATGQLGHLRDALYAWEATGLAAWDEQRNRDRAGYAADEPVLLARPGA
jgi:hypothetical protein